MRKQTQQLEAELNLFLIKLKIKQGQVPVYFTTIFDAFKKHLKGSAPLNSQALGRLLTQRFSKLQDRKNNKQVYLLNRDI